MKFGAVPLKDALGAVLAHSADLSSGRLRKGKVLEQADLDRMATEGWQDVVAARLDPDDMGEDAAATALGACLKGAGLRTTNAATGRVNLVAEGPGVVVLDPAAVDALNLINPLITLATLPQFARVSAGDLVATIKIIAYGVPQADVARAVAHAVPLRVQPPVYATACLIETLTGSDPGTKGRDALSTRLARLNAALGPRVLVRHDVAALSAAYAQCEAEVIFLLTASATSDPDDVAPAALRQAGGTVTRFGMPVDPGNLLFLGTLGNKPVIGLPGCARSPAVNGADWVLERVMCGVQVTSRDIALMGVGGLLKEIPTRPRPRNLDALGK